MWHMFFPEPNYWHGISGFMILAGALKDIHAPVRPVLHA
jgi:hypothetical protein